MTSKENGPWKVGELAAAVGLTVRTLHHYDETGLLRPSDRTDSGHRLYTKNDLHRLQRILSMRQLGFALEQIKEALNEPGYAWPAEKVLRLQIETLQQQIKDQQTLIERLQILERLITQNGAADVSAATFIDAMEAMQMLEKYYSKEQLNALEARKTALGPDRIKEVEDSWPKLMADVRAQMDAGADPQSPMVRGLATRWAALLAEFTGGDQGIERSLKTMYAKEPSAPQQFGMPPDMMKLAEFIRGAKV